MFWPISSAVQTPKHIIQNFTPTHLVEINGVHFFLFLSYVVSLSLNLHSFVFVMSILPLLPHSLSPLLLSSMVLIMLDAKNCSPPAKWSCYDRILELLWKVHFAAKISSCRITGLRRNEHNMVRDDRVLGHPMAPCRTGLSFIGLASG